MKKLYLGAMLMLAAASVSAQKANGLFDAKSMEYLKTVPYDLTRTTLYNAADLYEGYQPEKPETFQTCYDTKAYQHFMSKGKQTNSVEESLARTLHDQQIRTALNEFFTQHDARLCVGIMGGHALLRTDPVYRQIVLLSKQLTEKGFIMISGGGPGAMEATHLGAWMAGRTEEDVDAALKVLMTAPSFRDEGWLATSFDVMKRFPQDKHVSLGVPTFLYGHEPSAPFATHIAKFFENSIREDYILTQAYGGIIYTPGSAGTMQEIFQDAVQNHYLSFGFSSPMVFMGKKFWTKDMPVYPFLQKLVKKGTYKNMVLSLTDDSNAIVDELMKFRNSGAK